jgi:hypothetical protein
VTRSGPSSGAQCHLCAYIGGELASAAWDEQNGQCRDDGPSGADAEGDLKAGILGKPARQDVHGDEAAGDPRADAGPMLRKIVLTPVASAVSRFETALTAVDPHD